MITKRSYTEANIDNHKSGGSHTPLYTACSYIQGQRSLHSMRIKEKRYNLHGLRARQKEQLYRYICFLRRGTRSVFRQTYISNTYKHSEVQSKQEMIWNCAMCVCVCKCSTQAYARERNIYDCMTLYINVYMHTYTYGRKRISRL